MKDFILFLSIKPVRKNSLIIGSVIEMFDTGNVGFMLMASSLVMLMTPGLAFFYGGLVGGKKCTIHHDSKFCVHGCCGYHLGYRRLLSLF